MPLPLSDEPSVLDWVVFSTSRPPPGASVPPLPLIELSTWVLPLRLKVPPFIVSELA